MKTKKLLSIITTAFIISLTLATFAYAETTPPFTQNHFIVSGSGGELGSAGTGAYFGIDLSTPGTANGDTNPVVAPAYLPVLGKGLPSASSAGGAGGDITFGRKSGEYVFQNRLTIVAGKGGVTQHAGLGASGGTVRVYAKNLFINHDFTIIAGPGGKSGKGGDVIVDVAGNIFVEGEFIAYGGDPNEGGSGMTTIKADRISTGTGAGFARTGGSTHIDLDTLSASGKENSFYFSSQGAGGYMTADIDKLVINGKTKLLLDGTRTSINIPGSKKPTSEVEIDEILIRTNATLTITKSNGGDFEFEKLCAEESSYLASDLKLAGKELEFIINDSFIDDKTILLNTATALDVTGVKDIDIEIYTPLAKLQKGHQVILIDKVKGTMLPKKVSVDLPRRGNVYYFQVEVADNKLIATML